MSDEPNHLQGSQRPLLPPTPEVVDERPNPLEHIVRMMRKRRRKLEKRIKQARRDPTPDAIHDLRVAIRRFNAVCRCARRWEPKLADKSLKRLKKLMKPLGRLRDTHVQWELLDAAGVAGWPGCQDRIDALVGRERKLTKKALAGLKGFKMPKAASKLGRRLSGDLDSKSHNGWGIPEVRRELRRLWLDFLGWKGQAMSAENAEALHCMRLSLKRLRYAAEVFASLLDIPKENLGELHDMQTCMGNIHDCDVMMRQMEPTISFGEIALLDFLVKRRREQNDEFLKRLPHLEKSFPKAAGFGNELATSA